MSLWRQLFYKNRKYYDDDFDWDNYTADSYERRLKGDVALRKQLSQNGRKAAQLFDRKRLAMEMLDNLMPLHAVQKTYGKQTCAPTDRLE